MAVGNTFCVDQGDHVPTEVVDVRGAVDVGLQAKMGELGEEPGDIVFYIVVQSGGTVVVNKGEGENTVQFYGALAEGSGAVNISRYPSGFTKIKVEGSATPLDIDNVFAETDLETGKHFIPNLGEKLDRVRVFLE